MKLDFGYISNRFFERWTIQLTCTNFMGKESYILHAYLWQVETFSFADKRDKKKIVRKYEKFVFTEVYLVFYPLLQPNVLSGWKNSSK